MPKKIPSLTEIQYSKIYSLLRPYSKYSVNAPIYASYNPEIVAQAMKSLEVAQAHLCPHCHQPYVISWRGYYESGNRGLFWECYACGYGGDI